MRSQKPAGKPCGRSFGLRGWACIPAVLLSVQTAQAQKPDTVSDNDWDAIADIEPGRVVTVFLNTGVGAKVKGRFSASDPTSITVLAKDGQQKTTSRDRVRRVTVKRENMRYAPLIGAAAGAGIIGGAMASDSGDLVASGVAVFIGIGAGIGAAAGLVVRAVGGQKTVYTAPRQDGTK